MRILIIVLLPILIFNCNTRDSEEINELFTEKELFGRWYDLDTCSAFQVTDTSLMEVFRENANFTFKTDYTYDVESEIYCYDPLNGGSWNYNELERIVKFEEELFTDTVEIEIIGNLPRFEWEILSFSNQVLEVNHTVYQDASTANNEFKFVQTRRFEKRE